MNAEKERLAEAAAKSRHWRRWGPYLSERQWGTVREDYSADGDAWNFVTHDMAPHYAYRWGEDGLAGISDNHQRLCFAIALWNGRDPLLKERLFGLSNPQGNHGEDVKECYWHLDNTPTHSYMRFLYRYPHEEFPYRRLLEENDRRSRFEPEFELLDTGVFAENRFFDVTVEYAKADVEDVLVRITVVNRGDRPAPLHLLPTLWFRNDWSWGGDAVPPRIHLIGSAAVRATHPTLGARTLAFTGDPERLFTENLTNRERLYGAPNPSPHVKDAFHRWVIQGEKNAVATDEGSKFAVVHHWELGPGESQTVHLRLSDDESGDLLQGPDFDSVFERRKAEADEFYKSFAPGGLPPELAAIQRAAFSGLLWSKQWYHYVVERWLEGDPAQPKPPARRWQGRNADWLHLYNDDVLAMPDSWEYPWYAVWDSAFHAIALAYIDPDYAKRQLVRFTREWYMHPNGQLPAYEWSFDDVNPPVHAWAAFRVHKIEEKHWGKADLRFLERVFHKLLMNFTWWVNRKDRFGRNLFEGGFLGMDNIGVFDRSAPLPGGANLLQSDSTSWMAMYCLNMLRISWKLSESNAAYEDIASKFYEHFLYIANAMSDSRSGTSLWEEDDGFFYDHLMVPGGDMIPLRVRSMVGLVPLFAVEVLDLDKLNQIPGFKRRMEWFEDNRGDLTGKTCCIFEPNPKGRRKCLFSILGPEQLRRVLKVMFDEKEFLSPFGIRSLSKFHERNPFEFDLLDGSHTVRYEPGESTSLLFGGNSNWRGPIWFPMNYLIIESLQKHHHFWGDDFKIEYPTGSGNPMTLGEIACDLSRRLISLFVRKEGRRPAFGDRPVLQDDPLWRDHLLFHEYFHADTGEGLGASHQTGWTALVAKLIFQSGGSE